MLTAHSHMWLMYLHQHIVVSAYNSVTQWTVWLTCLHKNNITYIAIFFWTVDGQSVWQFVMGWHSLCRHKLNTNVSQYECIYYTCFCLTHRGITIANTYWYSIPTGTHQLNSGLFIGVYMSYCVVTIPISFDTHIHRPRSSHKKLHIHLDT